MKNGKTNFSQRVYSALKEAIAWGQLMPGERLTTEQAARMLHVSHTPVREAFSRLNQEGLVELRRNSGVTVTRITSRLALEIHQVRKALEPLAVRGLIEQGATPELHERLRFFAQAYQDAGTFTELIRADYNFHNVIHTAPGAGIFGKILTGQNILIASFCATSAQIPLRWSSQIKPRCTRQHFQLADAIADAEIDKAMLLMERHILGEDDFIAPSRVAEPAVLPLSRPPAAPARPVGRAARISVPGPLRRRRQPGVPRAKTHFKGNT